MNNATRLRPANGNSKLDYILFYAQNDARRRGLVLPNLSGADDEKIAHLARFMAQSEQFFAGDANLDNQKRNLAIRTFIDHPVDEIREHGLRWLDRHRKENGNALWFKEWEGILRTSSDDDIARIYLSADQEPTRQRISRPTGLMPFEVSLEVKQKGLPI